MPEPTRQIDDAIAHHEKKIELARYQIEYHQKEIARLKAVEEPKKNNGLGFNNKDG